MTLNTSRDNNKQAQSSMRGNDTCRSGATRDLERRRWQEADES